MRKEKWFTVFVDGAAINSECRLFSFRLSALKAFRLEDSGNEDHPTITLYLEGCPAPIRALIKPEHLSDLFLCIDAPGTCASTTSALTRQ